MTKSLLIILQYLFTYSNMYKILSNKLVLPQNNNT